MSLSRASGAKPWLTAQSWCEGYVLSEYWGDGSRWRGVSDMPRGSVTVPGLPNWETILPTWLFPPTSESRLEPSYWEPCVHVPVQVCGYVWGVYEYDLENSFLELSPMNFTQVWKTMML